MTAHRTRACIWEPAPRRRFEAVQHMGDYERGAQCPDRLHAASAGERRHHLAWQSVQDTGACVATGMIANLEIYRWVGGRRR
jgi:hypothetical protein